jgi:hypothetical protein
MVDKSGKKGNTSSTPIKRNRYARHKLPKRLESGSAGKPKGTANNNSRGVTDKAKNFVSKAVRTGAKAGAVAKVAAKVAGKASVPALALYGAGEAGYAVGTALNKKYKLSEKLTDKAEEFMKGRLGGYGQFESRVKR